MAVLLIGSTGNGKSTLGNFLVDPRKGGKKPFKTSTDYLPETQFVSQAAFKHGDKQMMVIDTPGLNEDNIRDLKHVIQIVEHLQRVDSILACVFVVKFNSSIDSQYKATVQYYKKLLPSLFDRNVIIVMTHYATDSRNVLMRKRQKIDVKQIENNAVRQIVESGTLSYSPHLFTLDCDPFDEEERAHSLAKREAILEKIISQEPISSESLYVAKLPFLQSQDNEKIKAHEGEITGFRERLQEANERATEALENIQQQQQEVDHHKRELKHLEVELAEKNSSDLVVVSSFPINEKWRPFQWISRGFKITSPCEIESVTKSDNGHCSWKDYEESKSEVKGKVESHFMRGIDASLSLEAQKRKKYKAEIELLTHQARITERNYQSHKDTLSQIKRQHSMHSSDIENFEKFISEKRALIDRYSSDYLTLEEARQRLKELGPSEAQQFTSEMADYSPQPLAGKKRKNTAEAPSTTKKTRSQKDC